MYIHCMRDATSLSNEDRRFFRLLSEAAATNPFTDLYPELLLKIADCRRSTPPEERLHLIVARVAEKVRRLDAAGRADISRHSGADRELLRRAFLFDAYHSFLPSFERLIKQQAAAGETAVRAPFGRDALSMLVTRGFTREEAVHSLALLYQISRAYFFIERGLIGRCASMKALRRHLWNNVFTADIPTYERTLWNRMEEFSTMLLGATGTGKGTAAAAIGQSGYIPYDEKNGAFAESYVASYRALNLSEFSETLIESELFGHRKGAFTGAVEAHQGVFSRSSPHGAIFLDEIGDVSVHVQIKLLNVLQERTFSPVGSHERMRFRGRIIAATNKPLEKLRAAREFRDDLFYRLCSDIVTVPSLRERIAEDPSEMDDLVSLIVSRVNSFSTGGETAPEIIDRVRRELARSPGSDYGWPGNVRELEQAVRRILITGSYEGDLHAAAPDLCARLQAGIASESFDAATLAAGYCTLLYQRHGTYEEVARRGKIDRRTAKANIERFTARVS